MAEMREFFISYNHADRQWAEWIAWTLEEAGYSVAIQAWDFRPGGNFVLEMQQAVANTKYTIVILSENYLKSAYSQGEWASAFASDPSGNQRFLVSIRVQDCQLTGLLAVINYLDLVGLSEEEARKAILKAFSSRAKPIQKPQFSNVNNQLLKKQIKFPGIQSSTPRYYDLRSTRLGGGFAVKGDVQIGGQFQDNFKLDESLFNEEKLALFQRLNSLSSEQLNQLIFTLNPSPGVIPPTNTPHANRVFALLLWAENTVELPKIKQVLELITSPEEVSVSKDIINSNSQQGTESLQDTESLLLNGLELNKRLLGDESPAIADGLSDLAGFYELQGRYSEAEPLLIQALELRRYSLGNEHPDVADTLNNLASLYESQGRYSEAEPLYVQALELNRHLLGESHPSVATSLNNLASLYDSQGRYSEAEPLYLQALELNRHLLGESHPSVATSLNNLAALYNSQGRYSEAEPLLVQALELRIQVLGKSHPDIATSLNNLATLYKLQGRYGEAEPLYVQALELNRQLLGESHPSVATSLNNLAALYNSQGRYGEAEPLLVQALELRIQVLGESHPDIATSLNNLATLYRSQGRYFEAEPLLLQALELRKRLLGEEHPDVAFSLNNLAGIYSSQGRYSEAEPLFIHALEISQKTLGSHHPLSIALQQNLEVIRGD